MLDASAIGEELSLVKRRPAGRFDFRVREGHLTPVFFGWALKNFGVGDLLDALGRLRAAAAAATGGQAPGRAGGSQACRPSCFKIQANMDPNHRDRIAFARLCSGKLTPRHEGEADAHRQADERCTRRNSSSRRTARWRTRPMPATWSAFPTTARLRIGDTLTEGEDLKLRWRAELRAGNPAPRAAAAMR